MDEKRKGRKAEAVSGYGKQVDIRVVGGLEKMLETTAWEG